MRYIFNFPDIGEGIQEGKILEWYVKKGQRVNSGESLVKMETDKVVTDIPSPKDGEIVNIYGQVGEVINVGDPLVELEIEDKDLKEPPEVVVAEKGFGVVGTIEAADDTAFLPASKEGFTESEEIVKPRKKSLATPVARAMAKDFGIDINKISGTGPGGRVMKKDILQFRENIQSEVVKSSPDIAEIPKIEYADLSQLRKTIAKKMVQSKQTAAHMTVIDEVEVSELVKIRETQKAGFLEKGVRLTYLSFVLKATVKALKSFPALNSEIDLENNRMMFKKYYNIGIAVDTEDGLIVPVIRDVDQLSILKLSKKIEDISRKAKERTLTLEDMRDGTFSVTNYGSIGGTFGVPVINYPQAAILGIGRIRKMPVVSDDNIIAGHVLPLSMSVDHRIVDGAEAARFIKKIMAYLKDPVSMLLTG
jgi:pyruvate dehydrogenase E2 component (dihydrolipoamide acetyltransferase)